MLRLIRAKTHQADRHLGLGFRLVAAAFAILRLATSAVSAEPLLLAIDQTSISASPGEILTFPGVITNRTGVTLTSTDLFLNFAGYDPTSLTPNQLLGNIPFTVPNFTSSAHVDLFDVEVSPSASGVEPLQVVLEDINTNLSDPVQITIDVTSAVPMSEPMGIPLLLVALLFFAILAKWRGYLPSPSLVQGAEEGFGR
jgi:hypothetical protein